MINSYGALRFLVAIHMMIIELLMQIWCQELGILPIVILMDMKL